jgi:hypothetical protein
LTAHALSLTCQRAQSLFEASRLPWSAIATVDIAAPANSAIKATPTSAEQVPNKASRHEKKLSACPLERSSDSTPGQTRCKSAPPPPPPAGPPLSLGPARPRNPRTGFCVLFLGLLWLQESERQGVTTLAAGQGTHP